MKFGLKSGQIRVSVRIKIRNILWRWWWGWGAGEDVCLLSVCVCVCVEQMGSGRCQRRWWRPLRPRARLHSHTLTVNTHSHWRVLFSHCFVFFRLLQIVFVPLKSGEKAFVWRVCHGRLPDHTSGPRRTWRKASAQTSTAFTVTAAASLLLPAGGLWLPLEWRGLLQ